MLEFHQILSLCRKLLPISKKTSSATRQIDIQNSPRFCQESFVHVARDFESKKQMSSEIKIQDLNSALQSIRSANMNLQNIAFYQSQSSSSSYQVTENSMSISITTDRDDIEYFCNILNELALHASNFENLVNLGFHDVQWHQRQLESLHTLLDKNSTINQLEFQRNTFGSKGICQLSEMLERNNGVRTIMLSECHIEPTGARFLAAALSKNNTLEELQIWEDSVGSKGAEDLARVIEVNPTLKLLTILDKESMTATPLIATIIARNRNMEVHIWCRDNGDGVNKVVEFTPGISSLRIFKLNLHDSCRVACALAWNITVRILDMTGIQLNSKWGREFRWVLEQNRSLKEVRLSRTSLRDKALVYIAAGLFKNESLEVLLLDQNRFTGVGVEHLLCPLSRFSALQNQANNTLKSLTIGGGKTKIGRHGLMSILRMLGTNQSVVQLCICGDSTLKPDDIIKIFRNLEHNATLKRLSLEGCSGVQGDMVLQVIMETLQVNPWIEEINLAGTPLQVAGKTDIIYEKLGQNGNIVPEKDLVNDLPMSMPTCCRIFCYGQEKAGKNSLCNSICHDVEHTKLPYMDHIRTLVNPIEQIMRRAEIKIRTIYDGDTKISIWNISSQHENFALHDLMFPSYESPSHFLIVSNLYQNNGIKGTEDIENDILYWLKLIVSNSRRATSTTILPHVTIVLTHLDKVRLQTEVLQPTAISIQTLRKRFRGFAEIYPTVFTVDARSPMSVSKLALHLRKTSKSILQKVPPVFTLCNDLVKLLSNWRSENSDKPAMKWKEFADLCQLKIPELRIRSRRDNIEKLDRRRRAVVSSLHHVGEVIFFEELGFLILDCEWFCNEVLGQLLRLDASKWERNEDNGFVSKNNLQKILRGTLQNKIPVMGPKFCDNLDPNDLIKMMLKLELCYEHYPGDPQTLLLVPALLEEGKLQLQKWQISSSECIYVGRQLECDDLNVSLTAGFFPRLQVHLYNKTLGFRRQHGVVYSIEKNLISITINGVHIIVQHGGHLGHEIDLLACSSKNVTETLRLFRQLLIPAIQSTCSSITFKEKIIRPDCVKYLTPQKLRKTQTVPLHQLKQALLSVPADSMYDYQHTWCSVVSNNTSVLLSGFDYARDLLSDEDFKEVLYRRYYDLQHLANELAVPLTQEPSQAVVNEPTYNIEPSLSGIAHGLEVVLQKLKILEHDIKDIKQEIQGLRYYEHQLLVELHRKVDHLVNYSAQIEERKVPNMFYFIQIENHSKRLITRIISGMSALRLHMLCEFRREIHVVDDQIGCELMQVDNQTIICLLPYLSSFMKLLTFSLKIGAHFVAGMGEMIPDLGKEIAHLVDSSLIYGAAAMTAGAIGVAAVGHMGGSRYRSRNAENARNMIHDMRVAQQWLVDFLKSQRVSSGKDIAERFGLWRVRYRDSGHIAWICRRHMTLRGSEVVEVPV